MRHSIGLLFALALCVSACNKEHADAIHDAVHGSGEGSHDHAKKAGPAGEFHAVLAPIWHADKGPDRTAKACDASKTMRERAGAIETSAPPEGAKAEDYTANAKALTVSVDALTAACAADGRPDVDAKLSQVHDAYHKVAEMAHGGHHEEEHH